MVSTISPPPGAGAARFHVPVQVPLSAPGVALEPPLGAPLPTPLLLLELAPPLPQAITNITEITITRLVISRTYHPGRVARDFTHRCAPICPATLHACRVRARIRLTLHETRPPAADDIVRAGATSARHWITPALTGEHLRALAGTTTGVWAVGCSELSFRCCDVVRSSSALAVLA